MNELWTNEEWHAAHETKHELFSLPGLGIASVYPDWMHIKHMGTDSYTYASVLWLLVFKLLAGSKIVCRCFKTKLSGAMWSNDFVFPFAFRRGELRFTAVGCYWVVCRDTQSIVS